MWILQPSINEKIVKQDNSSTMSGFFFVLISSQNVSTLTAAEFLQSFKLCLKSVPGPSEGLVLQLKRLACQNCYHGSCRNLRCGQPHSTRKPLDQLWTNQLFKWLMSTRCSLLSLWEQLLALCFLKTSQESSSPLIAELHSLLLG